MNVTNLPCLAAVRDAIFERGRSMNTHAVLETFTVEQTDAWTLAVCVVFANGERFQAEVDLLELMIESGYLELSEVLH